MPSNDIPGAQPDGELFVVLHGCWGTPRKMRGVVAAIKSVAPNAEVLVPRLPFAGPFGVLSFAAPEAIAMSIADAVDNAWNKRGGYRRITFVAHCFGGVMARKVAILAHGEVPAAPFEPQIARFAGGRPWAGKIDRMVLLAGFNQGWTISGAKDWLTSIMWGSCSTLGDLVQSATGRAPTVFAIRKGAPFLIQTRLQWLALMLRQNPPDMLTVQLIGTIDDLVPLDDAVDYNVDMASASKFRMLEVPHSGHFDVIKMVAPKAAAESGDDQPRELRWRRLLTALTATAEELEKAGIPRNHLADSLPPPPDLNVTDVVFVMHGIRDKGYWTQKIARQIKMLADSRGQNIRSVTASYGYLALLPFVLPSIRRHKAEWLMDRYTAAKAQYPNAQISYVGHSNGTYLVARALQDFPAARFKAIVLAGSVIRRDYDWASLVSEGADGKPPRVQAVLNYLATSDWVVASFPKAVEPLRRLFDLGSAGHSGFDQCRDDKLRGVHQVRFVKGAHGAGIKESQWDDIARFVVTGRPPEATDADYSKTQSVLVRAVAWFALPLVLASLALVLFGAAFLFAWALCSSPREWFQTGKCLAVPETPTAVARLVLLGLYVWLIGLVATRV